MAEPCYDAKYLVLHFLNGRLASTKITHSWRGALASKRNHEKQYDYKVLKEMFHYTDAQIATLVSRHDVTTRILPIEAVLAIKGLEAPDTSLSAQDAVLLRRMGIEIDDAGIPET